jgi:capsular polysaccharide transport system permease protein
VSLSEQEKKEIQEVYIQSLKKGQFDDSDFLKAEVERLMTSEPVIVERLFSRLNLLNKDKPEEQEAIKILKLKWELENTTPSEFAVRANNDATSKQGNTNQQSGKGAEVSSQVKHSLAFAQKHAFALFVLVPVVIFTLYLILLASPRYVSQAQFIVQQNNQSPSFDPSLTMLAGLSGGAERNDPELVKAYIFSADMLSYLEQEINFVEHYASSEYDVFSRMDDDASLEDRVDYLHQHIDVSIDPTSTILTVTVQAFTAEFAHSLNSVVTERAEWFINEIGQNLAKSQLAFIEADHARVEERFKEAQTQLLSFQREYNLLDPEAEGLALQQITFELESRIAAKSAELNALKGSMSAQAPMVMKMEEELSSLRRQLRAERNRLTNTGDVEVLAGANEIGVNDILAKFSDYKINLEFALQAYTASKVSLEASRIEAYQQLKHLVRIESPTLPEDAKYPRIIYNIALLLVVLIIVFGISKLIIATAHELK